VGFSYEKVTCSSFLEGTYSFDDWGNDDETSREILKSLDLT
jgi:hypothetical protein